MSRGNFVGIRGVKCLEQFERGQSLRKNYQVEAILRGQSFRENLLDAIKENI